MCKKFVSERRGGSSGPGSNVASGAEGEIASFLISYNVGRREVSFEEHCFIFIGRSLT